MLCDGITKDKFKRFENIFNIIALVINVAYFLTWLVGVIMIFGWNRKNRKPTFIKLIWIMLFFEVALRIAIFAVYFEIMQASNIV